MDNLDRLVPVDRFGRLKAASLRANEVPLDALSKFASSDAFSGLQKMAMRASKRMLNIVGSGASDFLNSLPGFNFNAFAKSMPSGADVGSVVEELLRRGAFRNTDQVMQFMQNVNMDPRAVKAFNQFSSGQFGKFKILRDPRGAGRVFIGPSVNGRVKGMEYVDGVYTPKANSRGAAAQRHGLDPSGEITRLNNEVAELRKAQGSGSTSGLTNWAQNNPVPAMGAGIGAGLVGANMMGGGRRGY